jgi:hypothetical protein
MSLRVSQCKHLLLLLLLLETRLLQPVQQQLQLRRVLLWQKCLFHIWQMIAARCCRVREVQMAAAAAAAVAVKLLLLL